MDDPTAAPAVIDFDPAVHEDLELFEMANLSRDDTGVPGTISVSTMRAGHGPRVKWYPGRPGGNSPFLVATIADPPSVIDQGLSTPDMARGSGPTRHWITLNAEALLLFWHTGETWDRREVSDFLDGLRKLG